jgi:copper chaperone
MIEFDVNALSCEHCARAVTQAVHDIDPQARIDVDLKSKKVKVESTQDRDRLARALSEAGYPPA